MISLSKFTVRTTKVTSSPGATEGHAWLYLDSAFEVNEGVRPAQVCIRMPIASGSHSLPRYRRTPPTSRSVLCIFQNVWP